MIIIKPISTNIRQIIKTDKERLIIREDSHNFEGKSNVYCIENSHIIWHAELPSEKDYYSNDLQPLGSNLKVSSWNGETVEIDSNTGKILKISLLNN